MKIAAERSTGLLNRAKGGNLIALMCESFSDGFLAMDFPIAMLLFSLVIVEEKGF